MPMARRRTVITYLAATLFLVGVALRYVVRFRANPSYSSVVAMLVVFLALFATEAMINRRLPWWIHLYLTIQIGITAALGLTIPMVDYYSGLPIALVLQAMHGLAPRVGYRWVGGITLIVAALLLAGLGWSVGLPLVLVQAAAYLMIAEYVASLRRAEKASSEGQRLLDELQTAHAQLEAFTTQAQDVAVNAERNRLARDLHDSVTQSLYSLTLFTQAAREHARSGSLESARNNLDRIADTAGQALKEMRLLVYELRPSALGEEGLVTALRNRLEAVEDRSSVHARLSVDATGELVLSARVEEALYRIAQEALNNTLKHAQASSVTVRLAQSDDRGLTQLTISDNGRGFSLDDATDRGGQGLRSIRERVKDLGGELRVDTSPGHGTTIEVEVLR
jgi:signal transduction histidine kinase